MNTAARQMPHEVVDGPLEAADAVQRRDGASDDRDAKARAHVLRGERPQQPAVDLLDARDDRWRRKPVMRIRPRRRAERLAQPVV